ncbi:MAG: HD domain-containing protein [Deltaproteobacteria bacterium]
MKSVFAKDIKAGDRVKELFLIADKNLAHSQKGMPYLNVKIKDKTGEIVCKVWDKAVELDGACQKGEVAFITGLASTYKGLIQLTINDIVPVSADKFESEDFFPTAKRDIEEMFAELMTIIDSVENVYLQPLLKSFFDDDAIARQFKKTPAAKGMHHTPIGGLLEHTLCVANLLNKIVTFYPSLNRDIVLTGGILHDIGKIRELSFGSLVEYTTEGRLIGHIVIGLEMLNSKIALIENFPENLSLELRHIMLSHHGEFEFGSPKRPKTKEALIIHQVDDMDAKLNAFEESINNSDEALSWTPYHRLLERFIYKGGV